MQKWIVVSCIGLSCTVCNRVSAAENGAVLGHIAHVENGLRGLVTIKGEQPQTMALAERMKVWHVPSVSIAVINNGTIEWARAYGVADAANKKPVTPGTLFQVASISKLVTATAALALIEKGKLSLDGDVNAGLVSWKIPENDYTQKAPVSLRHLLSHTSGISAHTESVAFGEKMPTLLDVLNGSPLAKAEPVQVKTVPGTAYRYANGGYGVAQMLMSDVTKSPFPAIMKKIVFDPLQMRASTFEQPLPAKFTALAAAGHDLQGVPLKCGWATHPIMAAGGLWATPTDLARLLIELQRSAAGKSNKILSADMVATMFTPVLNEYGLGVELDHDGAERVFAHSGSNPGYKSLLFAYTETGKGAVILTNGDYGSSLIDEIMRSIAAEYGWQDFLQQEKTVAAAKPHLHANFVGVFGVSGTTIKITSEKGHLFVEGPPLGPLKLELFPENDHRYFVREKLIEVTFKENEGKPVDELVFLDGRERKGVRIK